MRFKANPVIVILAVVFVLLVVLELLELTGVVSIYESVYQNFDVFIFALVFICLLSIVGAIFLGVYISHHIQSARQFTPFEEEMLKMSEDVRELRRQVEELRKGKT